MTTKKCVIWKQHLRTSLVPSPPPLRLGVWPQRGGLVTYKCIVPGRDSALPSPFDVYHPPRADSPQPTHLPGPHTRHMRVHLSSCALLLPARVGPQLVRCCVHIRRRMFCYAKPWFHASCSGSLVISSSPRWTPTCARCEIQTVVGLQIRDRPQLALTTSGGPPPTSSGAAQRSSHCPS